MQRPLTTRWQKALQDPDQKELDKARGLHQKEDDGRIPSRNTLRKAKAVKNPFANECSASMSLAGRYTAWHFEVYRQEEWIHVLFYCLTHGNLKLAQAVWTGEGAFPASLNATLCKPLGLGHWPGARTARGSFLGISTCVKILA